MRSSACANAVLGEAKVALHTVPESSELEPTGLSTLSRCLAACPSPRALESGQVWLTADVCLLSLLRASGLTGFRNAAPVPEPQVRELLLGEVLEEERPHSRHTSE